MVLRLFVVMCLSPYLLPVGVVAAPVPPLLSALIVPVLLLRSLPVPVNLLQFQALFHHRYHFHRYPPVDRLLRLLLLLSRHPLVAAPLKL